jgi:hypothetical protein
LKKKPGVERCATGSASVFIVASRLANEEKTLAEPVAHKQRSPAFSSMPGFSLRRVPKRPTRKAQRQTPGFEEKAGRWAGR